jgi:hypothetical protein
MAVSTCDGVVKIPIFGVATAREMLDVPMYASAFANHRSLNIGILT